MEEKTEYYTTTTTHTVPTVTTTTTTTTTTRHSNTTEVEEEDHKSYVLDEKHDHVYAEAADSHEQGNVEEYDANGNHINFVMTETEKKLIRKLDFIYVMPYVCILNFLQVKRKLAHKCCLHIIHNDD